MESLFTNVANRCEEDSCEKTLRVEYWREEKALTGD